MTVTLGEVQETNTRRKKYSTHLGFGLERAFFVLVAKSVHHLLLVISDPFEEFPSKIVLPEDILQAVRIRVDIISQERKLIGFWMPESRS